MWCVVLNNRVRLRRPQYVLYYGRHLVCTTAAARAVDGRHTLSKSRKRQTVCFWVVRLKQHQVAIELLST